MEGEATSIACQYDTNNVGEGSPALQGAPEPSTSVNYPPQFYYSSPFSLNMPFLPPLSSTNGAGNASAQQQQNPYATMNQQQAAAMMAMPYFNNLSMLFGNPSFNNGGNFQQQYMGKDGNGASTGMLPFLFGNNSLSNTTSASSLVLDPNSIMGLQHTDPEIETPRSNTTNENGYELDIQDDIGSQVSILLEMKQRCNILAASEYSPTSSMNGGAVDDDNNLIPLPPRRHSKLRTYNKAKTVVAKRLHKCPECSYTSSRRSNVNMHVRCHTGARPYKCDYPGCSHRCSQLSNLRAHELTHSTETIYACRFSGCRYRTLFEENFRAHQARKHNVKTNNATDNTDM